MKAAQTTVQCMNKSTVASKFGSCLPFYFKDNLSLRLYEYDANILRHPTEFKQVCIGCRLTGQRAGVSYLDYRLL